jgi:hypothetical protein
VEQRLAHERRRGAEQDRAAAVLGLDRRKKQIRAAVGRAIQEEIGGAEQFGLKVRLDDAWRRRCCSRPSRRGRSRCTSSASASCWACRPSTPARPTTRRRD